MAPAFSKLQVANTTLFSVTSGLSICLWAHSILRTRRKQKKNSKGEVKFIVAGDESDTDKKKIHINAAFLKSLRGILKILVPKFWSSESKYMALIALSLILRSICDIWMIDNGTCIESAIISQDLGQFKKYLFEFCIGLPTISLVTNMLKFSLSKLKLRFRDRLTEHLYSHYLKGFTYYKMSNLDNRISNADQLLTQDVEKFCDSVVDLYSNVSKPILDIMIYVQKLTHTIGGQAPGAMVLYLLISGTILTKLRRPISRLTVAEQKLEGEFRFVNSRLITNAEEIAFYNGNKREQKNIDTAFQRLMNHLKTFVDFRFNMGFVDNIIAKYIALCVGYCVVSYPFFTPSSPLSNTSQQHRMEYYYKSGRMLVKLAEAIGRLVLAGREMTRLAGFTARVQELMSVLSDLNKGTYQRTMLENKAQGSSNQSLKPGSGRVINMDNLIKFERVPLVTPNGDILVNELSFEVPSGRNVLVCGPNGCGKSSLFRILGELWPVFGGCVTKPTAGKLFYIPQRPYMTLGTLRDQVIYPDSISDMRARNLSDSELKELLDKVHLGHILDREDGGWDAVADWMDVLSGGEKQRIAMARLFYHRPQFAILDECTSAVSVDVEDNMYRYCRSVGITLFTVSHRKSLWKHHEYYLQMDGRGSFEYKPIDANTEEFGS